MIDTVKKKIHKLKAMIFENSMFLNTLENHQYLPLKEADLQLFEKHHQIKLPKAYRDFLKYIGNGGLGPNNGLIPLEMNKTYHELHLPWTDPKVHNSLFIHDNLIEDDDTYTERINTILNDDKSLGSKLYNASNHGVLCILDGGCGTYTVLVLNGDYKGQVWTNLMVSDEGFSFQAENFLMWFLNWLDGKIEQIKIKNKSIQGNTSRTVPFKSFANNIKALYKYIGVFKDTKDKTPVTRLFQQLLHVKSLSRNSIDMIINYCLHNEQFANYPLALEYIDRVLIKEKNQDSPFIKEKLCQKGKVFIELGEFSQAIPYFEKALTMSADYYPKGTLEEEYLRLLGYAYLQAHQQEKAKAVIAPPDETFDIDNAVLLLEELFKKYKNYTLAIIWGEILLDWNLFVKDPYYSQFLCTVYFNLAFSYARTLNEFKLNLYLKKLQELASGQSGLFFKQIILELYDTKYYKKTLNLLLKYESDPTTEKDSFWIYNLKGCCYSEMKNHEKAILFFRKSYTISHWLVPYSNLIRNYIQLEEFEKAKHVFDEIVDFDPYYSWSYYQFSLYHIKTNHFDKAVNMLKKSISMGFDKKVILDDIELSSIHAYFKE